MRATIIFRSSNTAGCIFFLKITEIYTASICLFRRSILRWLIAARTKYGYVEAAAAVQARCALKQKVWLMCEQPTAARGVRAVPYWPGRASVRALMLAPCPLALTPSQCSTFSSGTCKSTTLCHTRYKTVPNLATNSYVKKALYKTKSAACNQTSLAA